MRDYQVDSLIGWHAPYKLKRSLFRYEIQLDEQPLFSLGLDKGLAEIFCNALNGAYNNGKAAMYIAACFDLGIKNGTEKEDQANSKVGKKATQNPRLQLKLAGKSAGAYQRRRPKVRRPAGGLAQFRAEVQRYVETLQKKLNIFKREEE